MSVLAILAADAAEVTLAWDENTDDRLSGYKIYYDTDGAGPPYDGEGIDQGASPIDISMDDLDDVTAPQIKLTGLPDGAYQFAATAYDGSGNESGYSNEVAYTVDQRLPDAPIELMASYNPKTNMLSLSWKQAGDVPTDFWKIYYREKGQTDWIELDEVKYSEAPSLTKALTAVSVGEHKIIEFTVVAFRAQGQNSEDAAVASVEIDRKPPPPPVLTIRVNVPVE